MVATVDAVSAVTKEVDGTQPLVITKPSGVVSGNLMIAAVTQNTDGGTGWVAPGGWTDWLEGTQVSVETKIFYKVAGGSEAANYSFSNSTGSADQKIGRIWRISGQHVTWIDYTPTPAITGTQTTAVAPAETTTEPNVLALGVCGADRNRLSGATPPSGLSDEQHDDTEESANAAGLCSGWLLQAAAESTGTKEWTFESAASEQSNGFTIGIRSAAAGADAQPAAMMLGL